MLIHKVQSVMLLTLKLTNPYMPSIKMLNEIKKR